MNENKNNNLLFDNGFDEYRFIEKIKHGLYILGISENEVEAILGVEYKKDPNNPNLVVEKFDRIFRLAEERKSKGTHQVKSVLLNKIKQLEDRIDTFQNQQSKISALETKTANIESALSDLQQKVNSNSSEINSNKNDIDSLTNALSKLASVVSSLK